jgi:hypothetical protein
MSGVLSFPSQITCRPVDWPTTAAAILRKELTPMYFLECLYEFLKEFPSFLDIVVRHAIEILSAM